MGAGHLLCHKFGGPSVFPYQPAGVLKNRATPATWKISKGEDRYRRGLYTWVWRLTPHPNLPLFDAPDGVTACTSRNRSNVPVQALTLLNGPDFVEAARGLADRLFQRGGDTKRKLRFLYRTCLSREATAEELELLTGVMAAQQRAFAGNPKATRRVWPEVSDEVTAVEMATWIVIARIMMNLDEFITRE